MRKRTRNPESSDEDEMSLATIQKTKSDNHNKESYLFEEIQQCCDLCDKVFNNRYDILRHNARHIIIPLINQTIHTCVHCLFCFTSSYRLKRHMRMAHRNLTENAEIRPILDTAKQVAPSLVMPETQPKKVEPVLEAQAPKIAIVNDIQAKPSFEKKNNGLMLEISPILKPRNEIDQGRNSSILFNYLQAQTSNIQPDTLVLPDVPQPDMIIPDILMNLNRDAVKCGDIEANNQSVSKTRKPCNYSSESNNDNLYDVVKNYDLRVIHCQTEVDSIIDCDSDSLGEAVMNLKKEYGLAFKELRDDNLNDDSEGSSNLKSRILFEEDVVKEKPKECSRSVHYDDLIVMESLKCKVCGVWVKNRFQLIKHQTIHMKIRNMISWTHHTCKFCDRIICGPFKKLKKHYITAHGNKELPEEQRLIKCKICGLRYYEYSRHVYHYHRQINCQPETSSSNLAGTVKAVKVTTVNGEVVVELKEGFNLPKNVFLSCNICLKTTKDYFKVSKVKYVKPLKCYLCKRFSIDVCTIRKKIRPYNNKGLSNRERFELLAKKFIQIKKLNRF